MKEAEDLVLQMVGKGCNPDVVTYHSLISGYAKSGNTQKCIELYDKMKMVGIKPTIGTFHPLMYACRYVGMAEVERMFQEMLQMDLIPVESQKEKERVKKEKGSVFAPTDA